LPAARAGGPGPWAPAPPGRPGGGAPNPPGARPAGAVAFFGGPWAGRAGSGP
jgi:hypothetical protein